MVAVGDDKKKIDEIDPWALVDDSKIRKPWTGKVVLFILTERVSKYRFWLGRT